MTKALLRAALLSITATAALCAQSAKPVFTTILQEGVGLVGEVDGTLYGTFRNQIVSLTPAALPGGLWTESVLYAFPDSQGDITGLVMNPQAGGLPVFYGLTDLGGSSNLGLLFSLTPPASPAGSWTETDLYSFSGIDNTSYEQPLRPGRRQQGRFLWCHCGRDRGRASAYWQSGHGILTDPARISWWFLDAGDSLQFHSECFDHLSPWRCSA
jgi:hypothetical protein